MPRPKSRHPLKLLRTSYQTERVLSNIQNKQSCIRPIKTPYLRKCQLSPLNRFLTKGAPRLKRRDSKSSRSTNSTSTLPKSNFSRGSLSLRGFLLSVILKILSNDKQLRKRLTSSCSSWINFKGTRLKSKDLTLIRQPQKFL